jgi:hypothetical protein
MKKENIKHSASANGGYRHPLEALKFKRMGVSKGWPDLTIPYKRKHYGGLYIELKRLRGGVISEEQKEWLDFLKTQDYYATVANGFDEAKDIIVKYLNCAL